jgi:hypothetical protein
MCTSISHELLQQWEFLLPQVLEAISWACATQMCKGHIGMDFPVHFVSEPIGSLGLLHEFLQPVHDINQ